MTSRIVLAYSGGLAASVAIPWLAEQYRAEVVTVTLDLGQSRDLDEVRALALACGAIRAHVLDVREEFARDWMLPALQTGALREDGTPVHASLAYPLLAARLLEIARIEQADAVAHASAASSAAARGPGGIEAPVRALNPEMRVIAPARDWQMTVADQRAYARAKGIAVPVAGAYSVYETMSGRAIRWFADVPAAPDEAVYRLTRSVARASSTPAHIEITFDHGVPVAVNGIPMMLTELIESVTTIAGHHAVGRLTSNEPHTVYEAPAGVVLRAALDALGTEGRQSASGIVRIKLFRGQHTVMAQGPLGGLEPALTGSLHPALADQHP